MFYGLKYAYARRPRRRRTRRRRRQCAKQRRTTKAIGIGFGCKLHNLNVGNENHSGDLWQLIRLKLAVIKHAIWERPRDCLIMNVTTHFRSGQKQFGFRSSENYCRNAFEYKFLWEFLFVCLSSHCILWSARAHTHSLVRTHSRSRPERRMKLSISVWVANANESDSFSVFDSLHFGKLIKSGALLSQRHVPQFLNKRNEKCRTIQWVESNTTRAVVVL